MSPCCPLMEVLLDRRVPYSTTEDLDISLDANRPIVALYFL
ncbi:1952_t:CDS:2 [Rhizophagus irregularis]|nr:1952_t:CDS:2 [Rhizophagus irregularis]